MGERGLSREEEEKIIAFLKLSPRQRLQILENIHTLSHKTLTPYEKKKLAKLMAGMI